MGLMFAARMARWDLLRAISHLACFLSSLTRKCDRELRRDICYVNGALKLRQAAWIGDGPTKGSNCVEPHLYADVDLGYGRMPGAKSLDIWQALCSRRDDGDVLYLCLL